jgi:hypothetical protein
MLVKALGAAIVAIDIDQRALALELGPRTPSTRVPTTRHAESQS